MKQGVGRYDLAVPQESYGEVAIMSDGSFYMPSYGGGGGSVYQSPYIVPTTENPYGVAPAPLPEPTYDYVQPLSTYDEQPASSPIVAVTEPAVTSTAPPAGTEQLETTTPAPTTTTPATVTEVAKSNPMLLIGGGLLLFLLYKQNKKKRR